MTTRDRAEWRTYWRARDAWTLREFASLCCGWNPGEHQFPDRDSYNEAVESINRAVRVRALRTIDQLAWPPHDAEVLYDAVPAFRPSEVIEWAERHYPGRFPYSTMDAIEEAIEPRELASLLRLIAALAHRAGNLPLKQMSKAAEVIAADARALGLSISARTVEKHLRRALEEVPNSMK